MANLTIEVDCGDGAFMSIADPRSFEVGGVEWRLRYGHPERLMQEMRAMLAERQVEIDELQQEMDVAA